MRARAAATGAAQPAQSAASNQTWGSNCPADGHDRHAVAEPGQQVGELSLQTQAVGHDEVGGRQAVGIPRRGPVGVRVDARGHEALHLGPVAGDFPDQIRDDRRGAEDAGA
jgi:hypothetical protein